MSKHPQRYCALKVPSTGLLVASARALRQLAVLGSLLAAVACTTNFPNTAANRPDGEGYAGVGELIVRIRVLGDNTGWFEALMPRRTTRAFVELRYRGFNPAGRAVFERRDVDNLAGAPVGSRPAAASDTEAGSAGASLPPDTREILLDLRMARQIRIQGKIIEIVEASNSGVVFRLY